MTITSKLPDTKLNAAASIGEIIKEYAEDLTEDQIAMILGTDINHTNAILHNERPVSPLMCFRLAHYFDTSYLFWSNIMRNYEISLLDPIEGLVKEDIDSLKDRFSIVSDPDITDTTWQYHMTGEYTFSQGRGVNSLPIRIKLSGLSILSFDQPPRKGTTEEYEVWYHNMWVSPTQLPSHISIIMVSERRVSDTPMTER